MFRKSGIGKFKKMMIAAWLLAAINACVHDPLVPNGGPGPDPDPDPGPVESCDPNVVYFENEILPLFVSNCTMSGCHDPSTGQDGVVLNSYAAIMSSDVVDAGDASDSDLFEAITERDNDDRMPPAPANRLTAEQINKIALWINQGARNNSCENLSCDTAQVTYAGSVARILTAKCTGCHSGTAPSANVALNSFAGVQAVATNGRLVGAITHAAGFTAMPLGGSRLSDCEINTIRKWISEGAQNN